MNLELVREKYSNIIQLFEEVARSYPKNIAVEFNDELISYEQLNSNVNIFSSMLVKKGVGRGTIVAVHMNRTPDLIVTILSILKIGAVYMPINPKEPTERINNFIKVSGAEFVILDESLYYKGENLEAQKLLKFEIQKYNSFLESSKVTRDVKSSDLAYIIFTSGTTGIPKGVMIEHGSLLDRLCTLQEEFPIEPNGAYLFSTPISFDVSISEIFGWIFNGSRLVILDFQNEDNYEQLLTLISEKNISHMAIAPSVLHAIFKLCSQDYFKLIDRLKFLMVAGEVFTTNLAQICKSNFKNVEVVNLYGPTEVTVYSTMYSLNHYNTNESVPIGKPLKNTSFFIVDENGNLSKNQGELYLGGKGLARGYLNDSMLTNKKFVTNKKITYERLYRTGDIVQLDDSNNLIFIGRADNQIKINGIRIEPGEIENTILKYNGIDQVVVLLKEHNGKKYLSAYFTGNVKISELRKFLLSRLPDYMVPSSYQQIDKMPLNNNGKIDRKALDKFKEYFIHDNSYVEPTTKEQLLLSEIFKEILSVDKIGIDDDFFELGGTSLLVLEAVKAINTLFGTNLTKTNFYQYPTIRGIGEIVKSSQLEYAIEQNNQEKREFDSSEETILLNIINKNLDCIKCKLNSVGVLDEYECFIFQKLYLDRGFKSLISSSIEIENESNFERIKNTMVELINENSLLRTKITICTNNKLYKFVEFNCIDDINIQYYDATKLSINEIDRVKSTVLKRFESAILGNNQIDSQLFCFMVLKIPNNKFSILYLASHCIFDAFSKDLLQRKFFKHYNKSVSYKYNLNEYETYKEYINTIKCSCTENKIKRIIESIFVKEMRECIIEFNNEWDRIARPKTYKIIEYTVTEKDKSIFEIGTTQEAISMWIALKICFENFDVLKLPVVIISNMRRFGNNTYNNLLGDCHTGIPFYFTQSNDKDLKNNYFNTFKKFKEETYEKEAIHLEYIRYKDYPENKFNELYRLFKDIKIKFNYIGELSDEEESQFKGDILELYKNLRDLNSNKYRITAYSNKDRIVVCFLDGVSKQKSFDF